MISDEDAARTLLRESDIPPSQLDVEQLMTDSRRSLLRRRVGAMAGLAVGVVAVAVAVVVLPTGRETPPPEPSADFATTTRVVHRTSTVDGALTCTTTPLRRVDGDDRGMYPGVFDADASGERVVGSSTGGKALTLWTRGEPKQFTVPDVINMTATAVNGRGVVVGFGSATPLVNFRYDDGDTQLLKTPDGYGRVAVAEVNERGDALGVVATQEAFDFGLALVVWPADRPDAPRVVAEPLPGIDMHPLAIRNDGTVIALHTDLGKAWGSASAAVVVYRPDGTRLTIDAPPGIGHSSMSATGVLRGDYLFTTAQATAMVQPDPQKPAYESMVVRAVRWNLRTGLVEIFDRLSPGSLLTGNSAGGFVIEQGLFDGEPVLVAPNGRARTLTGGKAVAWVGSNGRALTGITPDGTAVTWRC